MRKITFQKGHNFYKLKYISLEEVKIVPFQQKILSDATESNLFNLRGLSQKVVDFLCYKKTIQCIAIKFYL